jgi:chaperonin GroES
MSKKGNIQKKSEVQPLADRVLIEVIKDDTDIVTSSGIYVPTSSEDRGSKRGKVIAIGSGRYDNGSIVPMNVRVGDIVLFGWGDTVTIDKIEYYLVKESEISAIIR